MYQEINKYTKAVCKQQLRLVDVDHPVIPTQLQMVKRPQRSKSEWDDENHCRKREDLENVFRQPPGNITADQMFKNSRDKAEQEAKRQCFDEQDRLTFISEKGNVVVVVGQAGIGKTTSVKTWCQETLEDKIWPNASMVLLRFVRDIDFSKKMTLLQFLFPAVVRDLYRAHQKDNEDIIEKLNEDPNIVLVFDGLDEAAVESLSIVPPEVALFEKAYPLHILLNLMSGKLLPRARKIFTSRPHQLYNLRSEHRPLFIVEIVGLNEEGQDVLGAQICQNKYPQIKDILNKNPSAFSYCYVPVNFIITLIYLLNDIEHVGTVTLTQVLASTCANYATSEHQRGREVASELNKLCQLAFEGFLEKKVAFEVSDLYNVGLNDSTVDSFLTTSVIESADIKMTILQGHKRKYFSHLIWQEFFAALHLMMILPIQEATSFFPRFFDAHWEVVSSFAFGLSNKTVFYHIKPILEKCSKQFWENKTRSLHEVVLSSPSLDQQKNLKVYRWVQETQNVVFARQFADHLPDVINLRGKFFPNDISNLFFILHAAEQPLDLKVNPNCKFVGDSLKRLVQTVSSMDKLVNRCICSVVIKA